MKQDLYIANDWLNKGLARMLFFPIADILIWTEIADITQDS